MREGIQEEEEMEGGEPQGEEQEMRDRGSPRERDQERKREEEREKEETKTQQERVKK